MSDYRGVRLMTRLKAHMLDALYSLTLRLSRSISNGSDVDLDIVKSNLAEYDRLLDIYREMYINKLTEEIKAASKDGCHYCFVSTMTDGMTTEFCDLVVSHFEARGFKVKIRFIDDMNIMGYVHISW